MKTAFKLAVLLMGVMVTQVTLAQNTKAKTTPKEPGKQAPVKRTPAPAAKVEVTVTLKNLAEANVAVYAGDKEGIRAPKVRVLGGRSTNVIYLKTGDVVCIVNDSKKAVSCAEIKAGTTTVEVNASGTVVTSR